MIRPFGGLGVYHRPLALPVVVDEVAVRHLEHLSGGGWIRDKGGRKRAAEVVVAGWCRPRFVATEGFKEKVAAGSFSKASGGVRESEWGASLGARRLCLLIVDLYVPEHGTRRTCSPPVGRRVFGKPRQTS